MRLSVLVDDLQESPVQSVIKPLLFQGYVETLSLRNADLY